MNYHEMDEVSGSSSTVGVQKVVVIQDASREVSWGAIRYLVTHTELLKAGDKLFLVPVLHQVNNPMGYKNKVDSSSMLGSNSRMVEEEVCRKDEQYRHNEDMMQLSLLCEMQIKFVLKVHVGNSPGVVSVQAASKLDATWVVLDRQMKKDKKYFMENLSCGISRMKRNNTIEQLRGCKTMDNTEQVADKSTSGYVSYGEMIPGDDEFSPQSKITPSEEPFFGRKPSLGDFCTAPRPDIHHKSDISSSKSSSSCSSDQTFWSSTIPSSASNNTKSSSCSSAEVKSSSSNPNKDKTYKQKAEELEKVRGFPNVICFVCKNKRPNARWKRHYSYAELYEATEGFSDKNFLSEGGFGCVFKGKLNGLKVAVKQHKDASFQGEKEFKSEVSVLSKARHQNLVMLLGSCSEGNHSLLVYEYVCNGSLDQHLSKHTKKPLDWDKRIKIALGAAEGLEFLHKSNIIHRDVRPNNILVTHDYESLLGDFGLARNHYGDLESLSENNVVGTLGYLAPEYAECGKASPSTDVYSFGVVLLQLITGLRTTDKSLGAKSLMEWAVPLLKENNYPDLIDNRIGDSFDVHQLFWLVRLTDNCLNLDPTKGYTMTRVVNALHYIMEGKESLDFSPTLSDSVSKSSNNSSADPTPKTKDQGIAISKTEEDVSITSEQRSNAVTAKEYYEEKSGVLYDETII